LQEVINLRFSCCRYTSSPKLIGGHICSLLFTLLRPTKFFGRGMSFGSKRAGHGFDEGRRISANGLDRPTTRLFGPLSSGCSRVRAFVLRAVFPRSYFLLYAMSTASNRASNCRRPLHLSDLRSLRVISGLHSIFSCRGSINMILELLSIEIMERVEA